VITLLSLLVACGPKTEESPQTLEEMTQGAITDFWSDAEADHVADLVDWLEENKDADVDGYYFSALSESAVADIEHDADINWDECLGAGVVMRVDGDLDAYVAGQVEADQSFADSTYSEWSRCTNRGTADGFLGGEELGTDNHVEKTNVGITIPYDMYKDYRWFGDVLAAVTWVPHAGYNDAGDNGIVGGFTIELWYQDDEGVVWYNGQWSDLKTVLDDYMAEHPDTALNLLISGTRDYMEGTEEHVIANLDAPLAEACE
jgi:hypothetical protein